MAKILVVDDSSSIRQLAEFTLKRANHQVVSAEDGQDALGKAKGDRFDLVLTDCNMPKMGGIDLAKALRAEANYKFTPILMLTTESDQSKKMEGKAAGVTGWVVKPFNPESLLATINKLTG